MKARELLAKYPMQFLVWNLNEETDVFWSDVSTLEDNGCFDPWHQRINISSGKKVYNRFEELIEYHLTVDCQGYPVELVILNE